MKITPEQLRAIQLLELDALIEVDRICRQLGIRYYLTYGTLLGAVRHKGFIPWDDDLDITIPRNGYERFLKEAPKLLNNKFVLQNHRNTAECAGQITELRINETILRQKSSANLNINHGVYIDIFPLDHITKRKWVLAAERFVLLALITTSYAKLGIHTSSNPVYTFLSDLFSKLIPLKTLRNTAERLTARFKNKPTGLVCSPLSPYALCSNHKEIFKEELFGTPQEVEFEGHQFMAPANPDAILRDIYGDYMTPPPINDRALRHTIVELNV